MANLNTVDSLFVNQHAATTATNEAKKNGDDGFFTPDTVTAGAAVLTAVAALGCAGKYLLSEDGRNEDK